MFDGPVPAVQVFSAPEKDQVAVGEWIAEHIKGGCEPHEIGVIVRSDGELKRGRAALKIAAARGSDLDEGAEPKRGSVAIGTMHLAKRLEFRCVAEMACDDEIKPSQERIESVADEADLEELRRRTPPALRRMHLSTRPPVSDRG